MSQIMKIINLGDTINPTLDPEKIAIIDIGQAPHRQYTYKELDTLADGIASGISDLNLPRGSRIAIISANSYYYLATYFGILRAGFVAVLINNRLPKKTIEQIIEESQSQVIFCDESVSSLVPTGVNKINMGTEINSFIRNQEFISTVPKKNETAIILYTSGSTGEPKGVEISHQNRSWLIYKKANIASETTKFKNFIQLVASPLCHMSGLTSAEVLCASHGTMVLMSSFDPIEYARAIDKYQIEVLLATPTMMTMLIQNEKLLSTLNLKSVRYVYIASAPANQKLIESVKKIFPRVGSRVFNSYGLTEIGAGLFIGTHPEGVPKPDMSVGYPTSEFEFRIVNDVLQIKSPSMLKGYHNNIETYKRALTEDGFYITNDLFRVDENGFYYFMGRSDDMFICGGQNVFPIEVEKMLESHLDVATAVVVGLPDQIKGTKPYGFVVLNDGAKTTEESLKKYSLENTSAHQHPRRIWRLKSLPLTPLGKTDRAMLKRFAEMLLNVGPGAIGNEFVIEF